jgi:hypothetical protein
MPTAARLYGVLDCARDPALYEHAARLSPDHAECLFAGKLDEEVLRASPFLVELAPSDPLSQQWRTAGWGKAWGILISSRESLPVVRRRLRRFTQARLPDGQGPMLFRFWDPRVFRDYLPLVAPQEIGGWFTEIDRYIVETEDGAGSLRYGLHEGRLVTEAGPPPAR